MVNLTCPICFSQISKDRIMGGKAYCSCGCSIRLSAPPSDTSKGAVPVIVFSIIFVATILHAINWDTYSLTIIPLKMKQLLGIASVAELKHVADICQSRKKLNCEVQALEKVFSIDARETQSLLRVGAIYMDTKNYLHATKTYSAYFSKGGKDTQARYLYARALGEVGKFKDAKKQFHYILKSDKKSPQYQVARSYVELLIKNRELETAKNIIEEYRGTGPSSAMFLEKELKSINQQLRSQSLKTASRGS
jgi:tetratricopeptide (TPR) repeat protein